MGLSNSKRLTVDWHSLTIIGETGSDNSIVKSYADFMLVVEFEWLLVLLLSEVWGSFWRLVRPAEA